MRSTAALLGCLSLVVLAGCASSSALVPEPPFPPSPRTRTVLTVEEDDPIAPETRNDDETRQRALEVMASEQRALLASLENEMRFVRASSGRERRVRDAIFATESELASIEREIFDIASEGAPSSNESRARRDEVKDRLRRVATRLSLLENAARDR